MKRKRVIIWVLGLIVIAACALQEQRGVVIHKRPVEGLSGYDVVIREAQEPEVFVYGVPDAQTPKEDKPEPEEEPASQSLRRERIPLRRNRYQASQASLD